MKAIESTESRSINGPISNAIAVLGNNNTVVSLGILDALFGEATVPS